MPFHNRQYTVFLLLAGPDAPALWQSPAWARFADDLRGHACPARGKAAVRTLQYTGAGKPAPFGRLGWDDKSAARWTHGEGGHDLRFGNVEAWAPSWTQCMREQLAPDFFLTVTNERMLGQPGKALRFNQRLVCAIALDLGAERAALLQGVLARWATVLHAPLFACQARPWGVGAGDGYTGGIQDMAATGLFKPGDPHARAVDAASLRDAWTVIQGRTS